MMVCELIALLQQQDPHFTVCHLGPYDLPECPAEIFGVRAEPSEPGFVYLTTALPPVATPRSPRSES